MQRAKPAQKETKRVNKAVKTTARTMDKKDSDYVIDGESPFPDSAEAVTIRTDVSDALEHASDAQAQGADISVPDSAHISYEPASDAHVNARGAKLQPAAAPAEENTDDDDDGGGKAVFDGSAPREIQEYKLIKEIANNRAGSRFTSDRCNGPRAHGTPARQDSSKSHLHAAPNTEIYNVEGPSHDSAPKVSGVKHIFGVAAIIIFLIALFFVPQMIGFAKGFSKTDLDFTASVISPSSVMAAGKAYGPDSVLLSYGTYDLALRYGSHLDEITLKAMVVDSDSGVPKIADVMVASVGVDGQVKSAMSFDLRSLEFERASIRVISQGKEIFMCDVWNEELDRCGLGTWTKLLDAAPGEVYQVSLSDTRFFVLAELI